MENVPQVISADNIDDFHSWCSFLESKGYKCYTQILNAKDYGVAQNRERCFMVSILGDYNYKFPQPIPLDKTMKDYLEDEVDEKYYINSEKAQKLIKAGKVTVNGETVTKPAYAVGALGHARIRVDKGEDYVSRGAYKLVGAFEAFHEQGLAEPKGLQCLDIGASTGGFCDVLLRRGAGHVVALDVGHGQLDPRIATDPRIIEMSGVNIRDVFADDLPFRPQMIVSDVSFISLTYVIPVIARIAAPGAAVVLLVKPQFEVGRDGLGKNGIVESEELRRKALHDVMDCARREGLNVVATAPSPIEGTHGNAEWLLYARTAQA